MQNPQIPNRYARSRGFTFIELMVTLAVLAVLVTLCASAFASIGAANRLAGATNGFIAHLHLARGEAIKRNQRVTLCKSPDGLVCSTRGGWQQGWIVFHDANENGAREPQEFVIDRMEALAGEIRVTGNLTVTGYVAYGPSGGTELLGGGFQAGTVTVCKHSWGRTDARKIVLNAAGRPRVQKTTVDSCV